MMRKVFVTAATILSLGVVSFLYVVISEIVIDEVVVQGTTSRNHERIKNLLPLKKGDSFWKADLAQVQHSLKSDPWVKDVQVHRKFGAKIDVLVTEKIPQAVINDQKGKFSLIDADAEIIDRAEIEDLAHWPTLKGVALLKQKTLRKQALEILDEIPSEGALAKDLIGEIDYTEEQGFRLLLTEGKIRIRLGKESLPVRVERVRRVVQYLKDNKINATHIDSDYEKKVLVKVQKPR